MKVSRSALLICLIIFGAPASRLNAIPLPGWFAGCIASGTGCQPLPAGTYDVASTLTVSASVTIQGASTNPYDTILKRAPELGINSAIMVVYASGVTIKNLTFDGNRFYSEFNCVGQDNQFDLHMANTAGTNDVQNVYLFSAPGTALNVHGHTRVYNSWISNAHYTGMHLYETSYALWNTVNNSGTGGITVWGFANELYGNTLTGNRLEMPDNSGGPQITLWQGATSALVHQNVLDGLFWQTSVGGYANGCPMPINQVQTVGGIEINNEFNLTNQSHKIYNNMIKRHSGTGILLHSTAGITIAGTDPLCPACNKLSVTDNNFNGLWSPATTTNLTLGDVRIFGNRQYSVNLQNAPASTTAACLEPNDGAYLLAGVLTTYPSATNVGCP